MKYLTHACAAAAIAIAGVLLLSTAGSQTAEAQTYSARAPGIIVMSCATGFSKTNASQSSHTKTYDCITPVIRCPTEQGWNAGQFTQAQPPVQTQSGIRLRYRCTYQSIS
jgi:hypothetical protein